MRYAIVGAVLLYCLSVCESFVCAQQPSTVAILGQGGRNQGSGVLCGGTADGRRFRTVLTAAHVVGPRGAKVLVAMDGRRLPGVVYGSDHVTDAALVLVRGRHITEVPNARLYMGAIRRDMRITTEGYRGTPQGMQWTASHGYPHRINGTYLVMRTGALPGMSGGPTYVGDRLFLTTSTASNFRNRTLGPYRTYLVKWIPTCGSSEFSFGVEPDGSVGVDELEGALVPDVPEVAAKKPEPKTDSADLEALRKQLAEMLAAQQAQKQAVQAEVEITPVDQAPKVYIKPVPQQPQTLPANTRDFTFEVPITLRIKTSESVQVEVVP